MDLVIGLLWFSAFSVIVLFLGALNYFLRRSQSDITNQQQQQSNRSSTSNNRRKHARNANRKQRQQAAAATINEDIQETKSIFSEIKIEGEESLIESSVQPTDEEEKEEEFHDPMEIEEVLISSPSTPIQDEQKPILPVKQRNKNKSNHTNSKSPSSSSSTPPISSKEESILPIKPQASVAPVKQFPPLMPTTNTKSIQIPQDNNSKSNGNLSSSCNIYSYSEYNSLPPRFQQKDAAALQRLRKRKTTIKTKKSSISPDSAARQNDFVPSVSKQQINNNNQLELPIQSSNQNGYSSESDILTGKNFVQR